MSKRSWIIAVALGLVCSGLAQAQEVVGPTLEDQPETPSGDTDTGDGANHNGQEEQLGTSDLLTILGSIERAIGNLEAQVDKTERQRQNESEERDLAAQENMAFWARWMFWATAATTVITAAALWAIVRTLVHTRTAANAAQEAVIEAQKTTSAANESNRIMQLERRPWVVLEQEVELEFFDRGHGGEITWNFQIRNRGSGVALDVAVHWCLMKRGHMQGMRDQLREYRDENMDRRWLPGNVVIFPQEVTKNIRFHGGGNSRYREDHYSETPEVGSVYPFTMLMACVTYRLSVATDDIGYDVRMFGIDPSDKWLGPWGYTILEYAQERLIG